MVAKDEVEVPVSIEDDVEALEQRIENHSTKAAAASGNGNHADADGAEAAEAEPEVAVAAEEAEEPGPDTSRLYFVRVPRPPMDETLLKNLQAEFQSHVVKIKAINSKLSTKREEVRELRRQMGQARSLKDTSQPEFEEKANRRKQLFDLRDTYQNKIVAIRDMLKGLECRSEEELEAKIKDLEAKIQSGEAALREEKQIVMQISRLGAQRSKVKEYDSQKSSLVELEAENTKIRALINEINAEFNILKTERDAAQKIISDFYSKLQVAEKDLKEVEEEQAEAVKAKNDALEELQRARDTVDASMKDYRENRKLSLQVRDLVAAGQAEEARALCVQQVEEMMVRLNGDAAFRSEYNKLWAAQRKFAVSELLPESSDAAAAAAPKPAAKGAKPAAKPAAVPRGQEKAKALIAGLMEQASREARAKTAAAAVEPDSDESSDEAEAVAPIPKPAPQPKAPVAPPALVTNPAAKAAEVFNTKVELPKVEDVVFVPPVMEKETEKVSKEQIREEQIRKAKEAEERKQRRQEVLDKKKVKAQEAKKREEEEKKAAAHRAAAAAAAAKAAAEAAARAAQQKAEEEAAEEAAAAASAPSGAPKASSGPKPAFTQLAKSQTTAAARRPANKGSWDKQLKKIWQQHQTPIAIAICVIALLLIILMVMRFGA